jgi:hypothetical protein
VGRANSDTPGAASGGATPQDFGNFLAANYAKFKKIMPLTAEKPQ